MFGCFVKINVIFRQDCTLVFIFRVRSKPFIGICKAEEKIKLRYAEIFLFLVVVRKNFDFSYCIRHSSYRQNGSSATVSTLAGIDSVLSLYTLAVASLPDLYIRSHP